VKLFHCTDYTACIGKEIEGKSGTTACIFILIPNASDVSNDSPFVPPGRPIFSTRTYTRKKEVSMT
jgi:hypothetical protein